MIKRAAYIIAITVIFVCFLCLASVAPGGSVAFIPAAENDGIITTQMAYVEPSGDIFRISASGNKYTVTDYFPSTATYNTLNEAMDAINNDDSEVKLLIIGDAPHLPMDIGTAAISLTRGKYVLLTHIRASGSMAIEVKTETYINYDSSLTITGTGIGYAVYDTLHINQAQTYAPDGTCMKLMNDGAEGGGKAVINLYGNNNGEYGRFETSGGTAIHSEDSGNIINAEGGNFICNGSGKIFDIGKSTLNISGGNTQVNGGNGTIVKLSDKGTVNINGAVLGCEGTGVAVRQSSGTVNISNGAQLYSYITSATGGVVVIEGANEGENAPVFNFYGGRIETMAKGSDNKSSMIYSTAKAGVINILGGVIEAWYGKAIYNGAVSGSSVTAVNIDGATLGADGMCIHNASDGKVTISETVQGTTKISGRNQSSDDSGASVYLSGTRTLSSASLVVNGGTFTNNHFGAVIINKTTGAVEINGGTLGTPNNCVFKNLSTGAVRISGGELNCGNYSAILNNAAAPISISGGVVKSKGEPSTCGPAIDNKSSGKITISEASGDIPTVIISDSIRGAISLSDTTADIGVILEISGGTVKNEGSRINICDAVKNLTKSNIEISGGTVSAPCGSAVYHESTGTATVTGGTLSGYYGVFLNAGSMTVSGGIIETNVGFGIFINSSCSQAINITGGIVRAKGYEGYAIQNLGEGTLTISGGTVSAADGVALSLQGTSTTTVRQDAPATPTLITSANEKGSHGEGNLGTVNVMGCTLNFLSGTIENTALNDDRILINVFSTYSAVNLGTVKYSKTIKYTIGSVAFSGTPIEPAVLSTVLFTLFDTSYTNNDTGGATATVISQLKSTAGSGIFKARFVVGKEAGGGTVTMAGWTYGAANPPTPQVQSDKNGTADVTFYYTGRNGTVYSSGTRPSNAGDYTVNATFPTTSQYTEATATANFTVRMATAPITVKPAESFKFTFTYGESFSKYDLSSYFASSIEGEFVWQPGESCIPLTYDQSATVIFYPTDGANYENAFAVVNIVVTKTTPVMNTQNGVYAYTYGEQLRIITLSETFKNAHSGAALSGSLEWKNGETVPAYGTTTAEITFTVTGVVSEYYLPLNTTVAITVEKADPVMYGQTGEYLYVYGESLNKYGLTAETFNIDGTFEWTDGTAVPDAGTLEATALFTPGDGNFNSKTFTVYIGVDRAYPSMASQTGTYSLVYGETLNSLQISETFSVDGTYYWYYGDTVFAAGTDSAEIYFEPDDSGNYNNKIFYVTISVANADVYFSQAETYTLTYGQLLGVLYLTLNSEECTDGAGNPVAGLFSFDDGDEAVKNAGTASVYITFTASDPSYNTGRFQLTLTIEKADPAMNAQAGTYTYTYGAALSTRTLTSESCNVAGTFSWTNGGLKPSVATATASITFTPSDTTNYNIMPFTVDITVNKADPVMNTQAGTYAYTYGERLDTKALAAESCDIDGTFDWADGTQALAAGTLTARVVFTPTDTANYNDGDFTVNITVAGADVYFSQTGEYKYTYGEQLGKLAATLLSEICTDSAGNPVAGTFSFDDGGEAVKNAGTASVYITFTASDSSYNPGSFQLTITVEKADPAMNAQAGTYTYTYGAALNTLTLTAESCNIAGTFSWTNGGTVPTVATAKASVTFTPSDTTNYNIMPFTVNITVNSADPVMNTQAGTYAYTYGERLDIKALTSESCDIDGTFDWADGTQVLPAGTLTARVVFTPDDTANYNNGYFSVNITVAGADVYFSQTGEYKYTYGEKLGKLAATLSSEICTDGAGNPVSGSFSFKDGGEVVKNAGTASVYIMFTPENPSYNICEFRLDITISKADPSMNAQAGTYTYTYGEALNTRTLTAESCNVGGTFSWTNGGLKPAAGTLTASITFTPSDTTNYNSKSFPVNITVNKADPVMNTQAGTYTYTYGERLDIKVLTAESCNIDGAFSWTNGGLKPAAGTLSASVTFTPSDTANYNGKSFTVNITVNKADPVMNTQSGTYVYTYSEALKTKTLSETSDAAGTFAWTDGNLVPVAGTTTASISFTPSDTSNYNSKSFTLNITVNKADPVMNTQSGMYVYILGETLNIKTIIESCNIEGSFDWANGALKPSLLTGMAEIIFTPSDTLNYNGKTFAVNITVKGIPVMNTQSGTYTYTYGERLDSKGLTSEACDVPGTFNWVNGTLKPNVGTLTAAVTFIPADTAKYNTVSFTVGITVNKADPVMNGQAGTYAYTYGAALNTYTLMAESCDIPGTFSWANGGLVPAAETITASTTFTPSDVANYNIKAFTVNITVLKASPIMNVSPGIYIYTYGERLDAKTLSESCDVDGAFAWTDGTLIPDIGTLTAAVTFTPDDGNYKVMSFNVNIFVGKATPVMNAQAGSYIFTYGEALNTKILSESCNVPGAFSWTLGNAVMKYGVWSISVNFIPDDKTRYNNIAFAVEITVNKADYDTSDILFANKSETYDGQPHSIFITGTLPEGVTVTYEGNGKTNAGTYTVTSKFTIPDSENYNYISDMTATLTIVRAAGNGSVTIGSWVSGSLAGVPVPESETNGTDNVIYEYKRKGESNDTYTTEIPTAAGEYTVRATFAATVNYEGYIATADFTVTAAPDDGNNNPGGNPGEDNPKDGGLSVGVIAGIACGSAAAAGLSGFAIFWFVIKKKKFKDLFAIFKKKESEEEK